MRKIKVLIVNTVNMGFTGISSVIMNYLCMTYQTIEYDVVICGNIEKGFEEKIREFAGGVYYPPCSRVKKPFSYFLWLKAIIKRNKYDAIHVHGNSGTMYFEIHAAKKAKVPIRIAHCHSTSCKYQFAHRILKPGLNRELTHAIACSAAAGSWLFSKEYTVLQNGIEVNKFVFSQAIRDKYRKELGLEDKLVIGHVGYMEAEKNQMFLLRVFKKLVKNRSDARLLLIGDGRLRAKIEDYIIRNDLIDYVKLLGNRADVSQLYKCMDVFAFPSVFEGLGMVLIEAQTSGLPCIASTGVPKDTNVLGLVEYLETQDGDIEKWCELIEDFCCTQIDRESCAELMKETPFNILKCTEKLYDIYKS